MKLQEQYDALIWRGVSEQTLRIVTDINGYNSETMLDILYAHAGLNDFDQEG